MMYKSGETVLIINESLGGMMIKFNCENPRSHPLDEIGMVGPI